MNSTNKIPHTETVPILSGYFPNKMDIAEVSAAAPPMADVALSMKETVMNASRSTIRSQNLKDTKATDILGLARKGASPRIRAVLPFW